MLPNQQSVLSRFVITKPTIPHKRFPFIAILLGLTLMIIPGIITINIVRPTGSIQGVTSNVTPSEIISMTNAARISAGIAPVQPVSQLMNAAQAKAKAMLASNSWSHNTPTQTPWQFIDGSGYQYLIAGENLARNYDSAEAVITAWLASPSHKNNLLNPNYTNIGVAVEIGDFPDKPNSVLIVQYFATKYESRNSNIHPSEYSLAPLLSAPTETNTPLIIGFIFLALCSSFILGILTKKMHLRHLQKHKIPAVSHWRK